MRKRLTRENIAGAIILAAVFFLISILPVLVGEAPPAWTGGGLAAFVDAHLAGRDRQKRGVEAVTITLSPLSAEHLPELKDLWRDPDVIRYTNIPDLCSQAEATLRLERLLDCQAGLPGTTIFTVLGDGHFCGIAGCPPVDAAQGAFGLFYQLLSGVWRQALDIWDYVRGPGIKKEECL